MKDTNPKDSVAQNKVPLGLVSPVAMAHEALALKAGAVKYGTANYRVMGASAMVYAHAAIRHLQKWINGEEFDQVDGTHHLGNVRACTAILLDCQHLGNLTDDRPPSMDLGELFDGLEQMSERLAKQYADKKPYHFTIKDSTGKLEYEPTEDESRYAFESVGAPLRGTTREQDLTDYIPGVKDRHGVEDAEIEKPRCIVGQRIVTKADAWFNPGKAGIVTKTDTNVFAVLFDETPSDFRNGGIWYSYDEGEPEPVVESKPKLKVGDKVRVISCPEPDFVGHVGTLGQIDDDEDGGFTLKVAFDHIVRSRHCFVSPEGREGLPFTEWYFEPEELEVLG